MTREELIRKWLDHDLNAEEIKVFKELGDYNALVKLSDAMQNFKAPEYTPSKELPTILNTISTKKPQTKWFLKIAKIAAVLVICFSAYYYSTTLDTTISTIAATKTVTELPDASTISLNASSSITYNKKNWTKERHVSLNGEAYFKVAKGKTFSVETTLGKVVVLGTQFNVKHRDNLFEVTCYEGSVRVDYITKSKILSPGDSFLILDGNYIAQEKETNVSPKWIANESYFKSMPFDHVLREFERQYNITITSKNVDLKQLFTGSFVHNDKTLALKSVTLPLHLSYSLENDGSIVLTRE